METEVMTTDESHDSEKPVFLGMKLTGTIKNGVFAGNVTHKYHNPTQDNTEIIMNMYAPLGAMVSKLSVKFSESGERIAKVVRSDEATEQYERRIKFGDTAVLFQHSGDLRDTFTLNVGNLLPGESAYAKMHFSLELKEEYGKFRLTVPTTEIQKYGDPARLGRKDYQEPRMSHFVENPLEVCVQIADENFHGNITSPNRGIHLKKKRNGNNEPVIEVSVDDNSFMDGDFILEIEPESLERKCYALVDVKKGIHYVMARHFVRQAKGRNRHAAVKVLIDNSSSMSGGDIDLARNFMQTFASFLEASDSCTLSMFGTKVEHVSKTPVYADRTGKKLISAFANMQKAHMGGTEIGYAVSRVVAMKHSDSRRDILIVTDGAINDNDEVVDAAQGHRCFIVGVGSASHEILKKISKATGGRYFAYQSGDNIDLIAKQVYQSIQSEKATEIAVTWPGNPLWTIEPSVIWGNQSVDCFAAYKEMPYGEINICYNQQGQGCRSQIHLSNADHFKGLSTLVQGKYIEHLVENNLLEKAKNLSIQWQWLGRGTNLILEHNRSADEKPNQLPRQIHPGQMTPAGSFGTTHKLADFSRRNRDHGGASEQMPPVVRFMSQSDHNAPDLGNKQLNIVRGIDTSQHPIDVPMTIRNELPLVPSEVIHLPNRYSLYIDGSLIANQPSLEKLLSDFLLQYFPKLLSHKQPVCWKVVWDANTDQLLYHDRRGNKIEQLEWFGGHGLRRDVERQIERQMKKSKAELIAFMDANNMIDPQLLLEICLFEFLLRQLNDASFPIAGSVVSLSKSIKEHLRRICKKDFLSFAEVLGISYNIRLFMRARGYSRFSPYSRHSSNPRYGMVIKELR